jgi:hypothetical protein
VVLPRGCFESFFGIVEEMWCCGWSVDGCIDLEAVSRVDAIQEGRELPRLRHPKLWRCVERSIASTCSTWSILISLAFLCCLFLELMAHHRMFL